MVNTVARQNQPHNEKQIAALVPFKWPKGQSGNPGGRPKRKPISDRYEYLAEIQLEPRLCEELKLPKGSTFGDAVTIMQFRKALEGRTEAIREIREAIEGKAIARVSVEEGPAGFRQVIVDMSAIPPRRDAT